MLSTTPSSSITDRTDSSRSSPTGATAQSKQLRTFSLLALALLIATVVALDYWWLGANTLPPHWDTANHMMSALRYHDVLAQCAADAGLTLPTAKHCIGELVYVDRNVYPPLFPFIGGVVIFLAGNSITALAMTNLPFVVILVMAMYVLGRTLHSRLAGVLAALLIISCPLVFQMSREFMLDFATLAMAAAAGACLVLSDRFRRADMTLLFGITLALGALTKFTVLSYLFVPSVYVFARLLIDGARGRIEARESRRRLAVLSVSLAIGVAIAALWYGPNREGFLGNLRQVAAIDVLGTGPFSIASLTYYPKALVHTQMGPPLFLVFLFGLWRFAARVIPEHRNLLLAWIVGIYAIQTPVANKGPHNDIGILIPIALVAAIGIASLTRRRPLAVVTVSALAVLQLAILTLPAQELGARVGTFGWEGVVTPFPRAEDWKIERVLTNLASEPGRVAVASDHLFVNGTTVQFFAMKDQLPFTVTPCWRLGTPFDFSKADIVIAKSDDAWIKRKGEGCFGGTHGHDEYAEVLHKLQTHAGGFVLRESIPLPDGTSLLVFTTEQLDRHAQASQQTPHL